MPTTTNNRRAYIRRSRYCVVVPAPELLCIDVAVTTQMGWRMSLRKGRACGGPAIAASDIDGWSVPSNQFGTSRTTGPRTGGGAGAC